MTAHKRLIAGAAVTALAMAVLPVAALPARLLLAWDLGAGTFLVLIWTMMLRSSHDDIQRRADLEDAGAIAVLILTVASAIASLVAIIVELRGLHAAVGSGGQDASCGLALAIVTVLVSWAFVHTIFALHYAHDFYTGRPDRGGLAFPGTSKPDYLDFAYFSFTMGAASQTSDVSITSSRMRRFVLVHTILSFLFNTTVLALAVNVGASLI